MRARQSRRVVEGGRRDVGRFGGTGEDVDARICVFGCASLVRWRAVL